MKTNRTFLLTALALLAITYSNAQIPLRLGNGVKPAVEKVLSTYPEHFRAIQGDTLNVTSNTAVFNSTVKPDGATECTLTQYLSSNLPDYSWQATMYESDDFEAAAKKYATCYQQLKNMTLRTSAGSCKMNGEYEQPNATKNFYSTLFVPTSDDPALNRLRLEILLEGDMTAWKLSILIYDRVHDDKEGNMIQGK
ncbi:hypothetical protein BH10BAC3_BH10BAC3_42010 [soil metagenome]